jgi:hypothetical protein
MVLRLRRGTKTAKRQAILDEWYREQMRDAVPPLVEKWQRLMGVDKTPPVLSRVLPRDPITDVVESTPRTKLEMSRMSIKRRLSQPYLPGSLSRRFRSAHHRGF